MNMKNKQAIVLLSGGLDSYIALDIASKSYHVVMALNFDYGQKAYKEESKASKKIAEKYNLKFLSIKLPYLKEICDNSLTNINKNDFDNFEEVWIPNRNGLFLNIAAVYCDKLKIDKIIIGLNKQEAQNFSDNSIEFIDSLNNCFTYSTQNHTEIFAPCSNMTKVDIINYAIDNNLGLDIIKSCYNGKKYSNKKHCLKCMSCKLLYDAVLNSKNPELIKELF